MLKNLTLWALVVPDQHTAKLSEKSEAIYGKTHMFYTLLKPYVLMQRSGNKVLLIC